MSKSVVVRLLEAGDVADYRAIRLSALETAPEAFGSVYAVEAPRPITRYAAQLTSSLIVGAYAEGQIVGMVGLKPEDGPRDDHKGVMWGLYVAPGSRKYGIGAALIAALLQAAQGVVEQVTLSVVAENAAAIALYERFGFKRYGMEPRALKSAAGYSDEILMVVFLETAAGLRGA